MEIRYYVGIGSDHHYFTLRCVIEDFNGRGEKIKRHCHIQNLSQNSVEAWEKAVDYVKNAGDGKLVGSQESLVEEMREIKRASAAELVERADRIKRDELAAEAFRLEIQQNQLELIAKGEIPFGRYVGCEIRFMPISYVNWLISMEEKSVVQNALVEYIRANHPELILPVADPSKRFDAKVGEKIEFSGVVIRSFVVDGFYGPVNFVFVVCDDGALLLQKGRWNADVGDRVNCKARLKAFDNYNGQMQSVISHVKEI